MQKSLSRQVLGVVGAASTAVVSFIVAVIPAGAMTVTFVRHGESQANADGIINTEVPGPGLTPTGQSQAEAIVAVLNSAPHDGVYASTMLRTAADARAPNTSSGAASGVTRWISGWAYMPYARWAVMRASS